MIFKPLIDNSSPPAPSRGAGPSAGAKRYGEVGCLARSCREGRLHDGLRLARKRDAKKEQSHVSG
jgi:hypothetical protein